jgi:photosystem II stability/assembly factor-like uncharacterized protein
MRKNAASYLLLWLAAASGSDLVEVGVVPGQSTEYPVLRIEFVDNVNAWAWGLRSLWQAHEGGLDWTKVTLPNTPEAAKGKFTLNSAPKLVDANFESVNAGWIRMEYVNGGAIASTIYRTDDAGKNWRALPPLPFGGETTGTVNSIYFLPGNQIGWIGGAKRSDPSQRITISPGCVSPPNRMALEPVILRTLDGGENWTQQQLPQLGGCPVSLVYFRTPLRGIAASGHHIYHSEDGGVTWQLSGFESSCSSPQWLSSERNEPLSISWTDGNNGWLGSLDGFLLKTADQGRSWCQIKRPGEIAGPPSGVGAFGTVYFETPRHGWFLGGDHKLYETDDAGATWSKVMGGANLSSISCNDFQCWGLSIDKLYRVDSKRR